MLSWPSCSHSAHHFSSSFGAAAGAAFEAPADNADTADLAVCDSFRIWEVGDAKGDRIPVLVGEATGDRTCVAVTGGVGVVRASGEGSRAKACDLDRGGVFGVASR
jgi:hypothetical protein